MKVHSQRIRTSACLIALIFSACAMNATAQTTPPAATAATADNGSGEILEITVTATRVERAGFQAPTPTTVLGSDLMQAQGINNIADLINESPAFRNSSTPTANTFAFQGTGGGNYVNLRGLGTNRTLVLLDGYRVVPSTTTGTTDLNLIPAIAIDRTEVVTGGASAAYGADAVAGVVNLLLKKSFNGFQAEAQTGQSRYGDDKENRISFIGGDNLFGGAVHLMVAGEYDKNEGIGTQAQRPWAALNVVAIGSGKPGTPEYIAPNAQFSFAAPGGVTAFGPLAGIAFSRNGDPYNFQYGTNYGSATSQSGGGNPLGWYTATIPMEVPVTRYSGIARLDGDVTSTIKAWGEFSYGYSGSDHDSVPFIGTVFTQADNAFLPASVANLITSSGMPGVVIGKLGTQDMPPYVNISSNATYRAAVGLTGSLPAEWTWDTHLEYGTNRFDSAVYNDILDYANSSSALYPASASPWALATDAVNSNGRIVCRSSIANPTNGCVPFNFIGIGQFSSAALAYVSGTSSQVARNDQYNATANVHGNPFSTWAGEVSVAAGYEYRRDTITGTSDALSQLGLFDVYNPRPVSGSLHDNEGYFEAVVPLLTDLPFAKSLNFDGAAREASYQLAGTATTWKAGLVYEMDSQFRIRASRSHDIRAPNLSETYSPTQSGQFASPSGYSGSPNAGLLLTQTSGNTALKPEKSDTTTFGFTYAPTYARGLHFTADWYKIELTDAIETLNVLTLLNGCFKQNNSGYCSEITYDANNPTVIDQVKLQPINVASVRTSGIDLELGYDVDVGPGHIAILGLGGYVHDIESSDSGNINRAGEIGGGVLSPSTYDAPHWVWQGNFHYSQGPLGFNAHVHYVGPGVLDATAQAGGSNAGLLLYPNGQSANDVAARWYLNLGVDYTVPLSNTRSKFQMYAGVNNVFNQTPPQNIAFGTGYGAGNAGTYYDPIGTAYFAGLRYKY